MNGWKVARRILLAALAACLLCFGSAEAKKPDNPGGGGGGGGGAGDNGGGVIYFAYEGDVYTMNDDGSGVAKVTGFNNYNGAWGDPSHDLHGGKRWFLQDRGGELFALSDDSDVVLLDLPLDSDLQILSEPIWRIDDAAVSFIGRRCDANGDVYEGGLYEVGYTVAAENGEGDLTGSDGPAVLIFETPVEEMFLDSDGYERPDMAYPDWGPDGVSFVYTALSANELRIGDVITGQFTILFADPSARSVSSARWSPAGDKLMFNYQPEIGHHRVMFINADGSGLKMLVRSSPSWTKTMGVWSPTGSHLLYHHWDHFYEDSYILRADANGSGKTRITDKSMGGGFFTPRALGWR